MRIPGVVGLVVMLVACSGGGGGGSGQTYSNPGTVLRTIQIGDQLRYALKVTDEDGTERGEFEQTYVTGPNYTTPNRQLQTIREQGVQTVDGAVVSTTTADYYQDMTNSIFLIADDAAVMDGPNFDAGSYPLEIQSPIGVGSSWSYDKAFVATGDRSERRTLNASVTGIETVSTPFGRFNAYRVVVASTCTSSSILAGCDVRSSQGVFWLYPPLGIVKASYTQNTTSFVTPTLQIEQELTDTNIAVP